MAIVPQPGQNTPALPNQTALTTAASQDTFYKNFLDTHLKGFYDGSNTKYKGARPSQIYQVLRNAGAQPLAAGNDVLGIWTAASVAGGIKATSTGLGTFVVDTGKATVGAGSHVPLVSPALQGVQNITSALDLFGSLAFWERAGEVLLGLVLIAVGTVKLAETNKAAQSITNAPVLKTGFKYAKYLVKL